MDCVIRVIKGPDAGAELTLPVGPTLVGRSASAGLRLDAPDVSWEHLVITRSGDDYTLENLSANGTWIEGNKVSGQCKLRLREQIRLSDKTVLRLEPVGAGSLMAGRWQPIAVALVLLFLGLIGYLLLKPARGPGVDDDWTRAYGLVGPWMERAERARRLPAGTADLFREAWRQEQLEDYKHSQHAWLRLKMSFDSVEDRLRAGALQRERPHALQRMLTPRKDDPEPDEDDMTAAAAEFVSRRLAWSTKQGKSSGGFLGGFGR
jgi:hypothetical protein